MMSAKFGRNAGRIAMVWMWGKMRLRGTSRGKGGAKESLGYIKGSFQTLLERLAGEVVRLGGSLHYGHVVRRIDGVTPDARLEAARRPGYISVLRPAKTDELPSPDWASHRGGRLTVVTDRDSDSFDAVLSTPAPSVLASLAPGLPEPWRSTALHQDYSSILCTTLVLKRSLSPIYWMWISDPQVPFSGLIEHTNYIPASEYQGRSIAYISHYTYTDEPIFRMSSSEVMGQYLPQLKRMSPGFDESWIEKRVFAHDRFAQPIVGVGFADQLLPYATPVPGLFSSAMSQVFPEDRGTNYAVRAGNQAADVIDEYLRAGRS
jgi:protoporphyrinogen oxidase